MRRSIRTIRPSKSQTSRRRFLAHALTAGQIAGACSIASLLPLRAADAQARPAEIRATEIAGLTLLQGAGCNVVAMPGPDGALMIDGGLAANADVLLQAVRTATGSDRVQMLINTHWHPEQTGANVPVGRNGGVIFAHENTRMFLSNRSRSALFDERLDPLPEVGRPTQTVREDGTLEFAGNRIDYGYLPQAHTDSDLYLHFPERNVLVAGGVVSGERWPLIDYHAGAWYGGRVRALQWLAELVRPDTTVIPADGRTLMGQEVVEQRDIYLELFDTLIDYMNGGFGAEDAVEHNPLAAYEDRYGDPSAFLDGAYRSMMIAYVPE
jgi:cyclase